MSHLLCLCSNQQHLLFLYDVPMKSLKLLHLTSKYTVVHMQHIGAQFCLLSKSLIKVLKKTSSEPLHEELWLNSDILLMGRCLVTGM